MSRNGTINIHDFMYLFKDYFHKVLATEWKLCGVSTYFMNLEVLCSNTFTQPPRSLAQGWRSQVAKNTFLWVKLTYRNLLKYLGMLGKCCESSKVLLITQTNVLCSLPICRLMYKYKACLHWIQSSYHCSNALRPHSVNHIIKSLNNTWVFRILTHSTVQFQSICHPYVTVTCLTKFLFHHFGWRAVTMEKFHQIGPS